MLSIFFISCYVFIGASLATAMLTDKRTNSSRKDAAFCISASILWPLAIGLASCWAVYDRLSEKLEIEKAFHRQRLLLFCSKLEKMGIISVDTYLQIKNRSFTHGTSK